MSGHPLRERWAVKLNTLPLDPPANAINQMAFALESALDSLAHDDLKAADLERERRRRGRLPGSLP